MHAYKGKEHLVITKELFARVLYAFDYDPLLIKREQSIIRFNILDLRIIRFRF